MAWFDFSEVNAATTRVRHWSEEMMYRPANWPSRISDDSSEFVKARNSKGDRLAKNRRVAASDGAVDHIIGARP